MTEGKEDATEKLEWTQALLQRADATEMEKLGELKGTLKQNEI